MGSSLSKYMRKRRETKEAVREVDDDVTAACETAVVETAVKLDRASDCEGNSDVACESASNSSGSRCQYPQYSPRFLLRHGLVLGYSPFVQSSEIAVQAGAPYVDRCDRGTGRCRARYSTATATATAEGGKVPREEEDSPLKINLRETAIQQNLPIGSHVENQRNAEVARKSMNCNRSDSVNKSIPAKSSKEKSGGERNTSRPSPFGSSSTVLFACKCARNARNSTQCEIAPVKCQFFLKERDDIDKMLHDPADRRIRKICDRFACDLQVHAKRKRAGFVQYKVEISAMDLKAVKLCVRNLDFALGWNMSPQHGPKSHPPLN